MSIPDIASDEILVSVINELKYCLKQSHSFATLPERIEYIDSYLRSK